MNRKGFTEMVPRKGNDDSETLAVQALGFLASDEERLGRFLALTGLGPENLRAAAASPGFLASVLAHVAQDERLLMAFADAAGITPERVGRAAQHLGGPPPPEFGA
jgi:Protein of unknown function (DUF3572)